MIYVTGDTHRRFDRIELFCHKFATTTDDVLVILGDAGINYYGGVRDSDVKRRLSKLPITFLCIHGNHEMRPQNIPGYAVTEFHHGIALRQPEYPNILFAVDGEIYHLNEQRCMVIGGAYSPDKDHRINLGASWWADEQPSIATKSHVEQVLRANSNIVDTFLTHTCPYKYLPVEVFLPHIDQTRVDNTTERWLDTIEEATRYSQWLCGHHHIDKAVDKVRFMYTDIRTL